MPIGRDWPESAGSLPRSSTAVRYDAGMRMQCPASLRKFGFCGVLATIYAAKLPMPTSIEKLKALLQEMKAVLAKPSGKWKRATPKNTGGITFQDTLGLLEHYQACQHELLITPNGNAGPTLKKWMKSITANTCYIVHLPKHALFVEVGTVKSKWRLYDQGGVHTKTNTSFMDKKGGYGRQKIRGLIRITYPHAN